MPDLDERWEQTILRCLARNPGERFASVLDVGRALRGEAERDAGAAVASALAPGDREAGGEASCDDRDPMRLVEREAELAARAALAHDGGILSIEAGVGYGKTALVDAA